MRITVASTAQGCQDWLLDIDVKDNFSVLALKRLLSKPPYLLDVTSSTKVLGRGEKGVLMTLFDNEKVREFVWLLNVTPEKVLRFPDGFVWGVATAAYQIEGAATQGGRSPSIWDTFAATPGKTFNGETGAVACDHYHRFAEDVLLLQSLGLQSYRFSISWSRLLPHGRDEVPIGAAVEFYSKLIDSLLAKGIDPLVTLYHWDLPQCLEDEYGGWLGNNIIDDFEHYAQICFSTFGDKVKSWITLNEPWCAAVCGYVSGAHAPGRSCDPQREPYLAAHHMILAHAKAARCYQEEFKASQGGVIGLALIMDWKEPLTSSEEDAQAQLRALDWQLGWFADPIYKGDYPETMRQACQERLPRFSDEERTMVQGSTDFFGLNHYSTDFVTSCRNASRGGYFDDMEVQTISDPNWSKTAMGMDIVPWGLERLLSWIQKEYSPEGGIIITENGCAVQEDTVEQASNDTTRIEYLRSYIAQMHKSITNGADVRGYYAWSFMDNFEWAFGYSMRFGVVRVNFQTQERIPKKSAFFLSDIAKRNSVHILPDVLLKSDFIAYSATKLTQRAAVDRSSPDSATPALSLEVFKTMQREFVDRYSEKAFQDAVVEVYKKFALSGDVLETSKSVRSVCLTVEADILPKYGFEPNYRGVAKVQSFATSKGFVKDAEVSNLNAAIKHLLEDKPLAIALQGAM